jgi:hypothetical protein
MQQRGFSDLLSDEAHAVLAQADRLAPGQQRFAQLIEQLLALAPKVEEAPPKEDTAGEAAAA